MSTTRMILMSFSCNNTIVFLQSSIEHLGLEKRVGLLRADLGLSDKAFLEYLDRYTAATRLMSLLQLALINARSWSMQGGAGY